MWKSTLRRFLIAIPQLLAVSLVVFALAQFLPGDPLQGLIVEDGTLDPERVHEMRVAAGLYDPVWQRYFTWIGNMLRGDFGRSLNWRRPVIELVGERLSNSMLLSGLTLIMVYTVAVPLGLIAGRYKGRVAEKVISFWNFIQMSFPTIIFAVILLWVFAIILQWFPISGSRNALLVHQSWWVVFRDRIHHAMLPAIAGAALAGVAIVQFLSNEVNDQKNLEYTTTALGKGVPLNKVYTRHIFRNSLLPIASGLGSAIVGIFGSGVIIENLFTFRGMGNLFVTGLNNQDWPVVNFLVMFYGALTIIGFLISDIMLTIFDPRIRIK
ncbi:MAG: ABC transporter permease [Defluviitaleaceae bacterium]|nr:ABC transporter permease [Defluviitaleaceae bacterium]